MVKHKIETSSGNMLIFHTVQNF